MLFVFETLVVRWFEIDVDMQMMRKKDNKIRDKGAKIISAAIASSTSLNELNMSSLV